MRGEGALGRQGPAPGVLAVVDQVLVDLVGDDPQIVARRPLDDRLEPGARDHPPGRVVRRVDVDRAGARGAVRLETLDRGLGRIDAAVERHLDRRAVERAHDALDQRPVGREQQHLVAGLEDRADDGAERAGGAGGDQHALALVRDARGRRRARYQVVDQPRQPFGLRVAVHARVLGDAQVLHPGAFGRLHPGVADVERIDLALERAQLLGERGEDRAADLGDGARGVGIGRHPDPILSGRKRWLDARCGPDSARGEPLPRVSPW